LTSAQVLLTGPSGSGKTQLCRALADVVDACYVKADATTFSATGYVGRDVDDVIHQLVDAAGDDSQAAEFGVVHVDEIDKVAERPAGLLGGGGTVNTRDVQTALLKLMEDAEVPINRGAATGARAARKGPFSTKHVLFIFSGAFEHMAAAPTPQDLVDAGLCREFVGRVPVRCALDPLSIDDLMAILAADSDLSPLAQWADMFEAHNIALAWDREALAVIALRAHQHGLGARALVTELDLVLRDLAFALPGTYAGELFLDAALVEDPAAALERLLAGAGRGRQAAVG